MAGTMATSTTPISTSGEAELKLSRKPPKPAVYKWLGSALGGDGSEAIKSRAELAVAEPRQHYVIRIAAIAALIVVGKYYALTDDTEVYRIAIIMCPDKKMEWFNKNPGWRPEDRAEADRIVRHRWQSVSTSSSAGPSASAPKKASKWTTQRDVPQGVIYPPDSIEAYLASPPMAESKLTLAEEEGGYRAGILRYWDNALSTRPQLARMALDFLSALASSVVSVTEPIYR
ncbi:hypothetical protein B0H12DRAFT_1243849 [Mycena haematopus]|nr:hypothetical protein B0H12DRAFT_1243849 [Mycena haematopus]